MLTIVSRNFQSVIQSSLLLMSLVFLKIPRLPFSSRLVKKNWVSAGFFWLTSQLSLSNLPFPLSKLNCHFRFQPISSWSFFFRLNRPFGFSTRLDFNWLSCPFRFSIQPPFFFKWAAFSGFQLIYFFFLFFFPFFSDHSIMHLRIQNLFKTDAKFKRIISLKALWISILQRTNSSV